MSKPKVLIYDIETAPIIGTVWGKYEQNLIWSIQDWYMLCFAYKWLGQKKTYVVSQDDFKGYKPGSEDDSKVIKELHRLFNEADVVIAHNGDRFDQRKSRTRMIMNKLDPNSPFQQIDTMKIARKEFAFTSNKLDDLGEYLGVGKKIPTDMTLWKGCMAGDPKAWRKMKRYNKQDVDLLEAVYNKLMPWATTHPNFSNITGEAEACPKCGSTSLQKGGWRYAKTAKYRRWKCNNCAGWFQSRKGEKNDKPRFV